MDPKNILFQINEIKKIIDSANQQLTELEKQLLESRQLKNDKTEANIQTGDTQNPTEILHATANETQTQDAYSSIESEITQTEQSASEYDNIPISQALVKKLNIDKSMNEFLNKSIDLKSKMKEVIQKRLESTQVLNRKQTPMTVGFNKNSRNPQVLLQKKLKILDDLEIIFNQCIETLNNTDLNTTPLLDMLDKLYEQDDILFNINKQAQTPTHHGPIIQLIENATGVLLEFIKEAITASQTSKPSN